MSQAESNDSRDRVERKSTDRPSLEPANYPIPRPPVGQDDPRFNMGFVINVAALLRDAGFPPVQGTDWASLMTTLFDFVYESSTLSPGAESRAVALLDESRPADDPSRFHSRPEAARAANRAGDPLRRFDRLQDPAPWDSAEPAVAPWNEGEAGQPPACSAHDWDALDCPACGDLRRAFYLEIQSRMASAADEIGPCAGGRCIDPKAHAEGAHDL